MFDIRSTGNKTFEIVTDGTFEMFPYDNSHAVLRGFYSSVYKKYVISEMASPWWFTGDELREVAELLDYYNQT